MSASAPRPGSIVTSRLASSTRTIAASSGTWFIVGTSDKGPLTPREIRSLQEFVTVFGSRQTYSLLYDSLEAFFRNGGSRAYVSRVVGPAPVVASVELDDSSAGTPFALVVSAKGPGDYANTLRITVTGGGGSTPYVITVSDTVLGTLEVSPSLEDQAAAVAWSQQSNWVDIALGTGSTNPVAVADAALVGGTDDRASITDDQWLAALQRFGLDLGPGQLSAPGRTSATGKQQLRDQAAIQDRFAYIDLVDSPTAATVMAAVTTDLRDADNDRYCMAFAPWVVIPGLVPGTTRVVPPSAIVAGLTAKLAGQGLSANKAAAGDPEGVIDWMVSLSQPAFDNGSGVDVTRDAMYTAGVNQIAYRFGEYKVFGWRTAASDQGANAEWVNAGNSRLNMEIIHKSLRIVENYILDEIDGAGLLFKQFQGDLIGMLAPYWPKSLFGATPEEAFIVDVGDSVNTPATIANREIHAQIGVRMSQNAELVYIDIAKVPVNQALVAA